MKQLLAVRGIKSVSETEPAIFEIELLLEAGETATVKLNAFALADLFAKLAPHVQG